MGYNEVCKKLKIPKEIIAHIASEWKEIDNMYLLSLFKNAKEKQEELKKRGLNIQIGNNNDKKDDKQTFQKNYKIEAENQIKDALCKFLEVITRDNLQGDYIRMIEQLKNIGDFGRFLKSAMIYTRMHTKLKEIEDKFIYLCVAVEAAKRYNTGNREGPTTTFVNFFLNNLSDDSLELALSYFEVMRATEKYDKIKEDEKRHLFKYIYQKRSNFVHEGKLFPHSGKSSEWLLDIYRPDWRNDPNWKVYVRFNMPFEVLCGLYEEALLAEFKHREGT